MLVCILYKWIIVSRNRIFYKQKNPDSIKNRDSKKATTYSPTNVVPSALMGLTSLFGMVRGEPHRYNHLKS